MPNRAETILAELSVDEKVSLLSGRDTWRTASIERLGVASVKVTDGPNGARGDSTTGARAVCLPASIALGASFDVDLVAEVGRLLGQETVRKGAQVLLAPTINLARHPLGGRNFESFGEDPTLTAALAVAYVTGVQDVGVGACAKHFVANDVEHARLTVSSEVDERTLREVYLLPFEAVVDADVWSLMAAYPRLNGEFCTEHHWLLTDLLRHEWGYSGLVMSDWGATHHRSRPVAAGMDLEMPGPPLALGPHLLAAVEEGELDQGTLDRAAARVLDLVVRSGRLGQLQEEPEQSLDLDDDRAVARRAARHGMVLLRNEGTLPLSSDLGTIAVIGPNADPGVIQGGGSAQVPAHRVVSPVDGIREVFTDATVTAAPGCLAHRYLPAIDRELLTGDGEHTVELEIFAGDDLDAEPVVVRHPRSIAALVHGGLDDLPDPMKWSQRWRTSMRVDQTGLHRFGVAAVGPSRVLIDGETVADNWTAPRPGDTFFQHGSAEVVGEVHLEAGTTVEIVVEWIRGDFELLAGLRFGHLPPIDEEALMDAAVEAAEAADAAVVVVGLNADWETESHDRPMFGLPGRQDELVRRVAAANPTTVIVVNAGGPVDLPWLDEVPATLMAWYPGQELGGAVADVLAGHEPGGRLPVTFPRTLDDAPTAGLVPGDGDTLHYGERLLVGHRWYDANGVEPRIPFGFGLSYTRFEIGEPTVADRHGPAADAGATLRVPVANVGDRTGKCVVQIYLEPPAGEHERPARQLAGFASAWLEPGGQEVVTIEVQERAFQIWTAETGWTTPPGPYRLQVATSSRHDIGSVVIER